MGWGTGNLGGGSGGLNFKVVGYATEAELLADTPKENTIGIITTNKITGWMFAAADPAEPVEGMVYITTGTDSDIAFNALKKNGIQVYPLSAKQYVSGAWVDVTAMSYQGGEWQNWVTYLYNEGDKCSDITGGWVKKGDYVSVTENADSMKIESAAYANTGWYHTKNKIDLSNYSTMTFDGIINVIDVDTETIFGVNDTMEEYNSDYIAKYYASKNSNGIIEIDVSGVTGKHYVCFEVRDPDNYFVVRRLYLA